MSMRQSMDLDRIQRALVRAWVTPAIADEAVHVRWADQPYPQVGTRFVVLNFAAPPATRQIDHTDRLVVRPSLIRAVVAATFPAGQRLRLLVNRYPHDVVVVGANDPGAARTALVTAVNAGPEPVVAAPGVGVGELTLAPAGPGGLMGARGVPHGLLTLSTLATEDVFETGGSRVATLSVSVHAPRGTGRTSADQIAVDLVTHLSDGAIRRALNREGIGVWQITPPRDLSGLEGTEFERRIQFDVRLGLRARLTGTGIPIESVELAGTVADVERTFTVEVPEP